MAFVPTTFPGLIIIEPVVFEDSRGYFFESFNERVFHSHNINISFIQDNQSKSSYGVIRGLHYQRAPHAQSKLIRVLRGAILDIAVDLRVGSATYGQSFSLELSAENKKQLLIPKGFAHGFSVISDVAEVLYKCDAYYHKESESGIIYNDPDLSIDWKIPADKAMISEKDKFLPSFKDYKGEFAYKPQH